MPHFALRSARLPLALTCVLLVIGCGGQKDISFAEIHDGNIGTGQPAVIRETGKPVSGRVVNHNAAGVVIAAMEFRDGYPNGKAQHWYDNGQLRSEIEQRVVDRDSRKVLVRTGLERQWCENGQLQTEMRRDRDGVQEGEHRTWDCEGRQLSLITHPEGPMKRWQPRPDGGTVLVEEGHRVSGGGWQGVHRLFHPDGSPAQEEHWDNGKRQGLARRWDTAGVLTESGEWRDDKRTGTWMTRASNTLVYRDYDPDSFVNPDYQAPFVQAAGIQFSSPGSRAPLGTSTRVDLERLEYYVKQGLIDPRRKLNQDQSRRTGDFSSSAWSYPYVRASSAALEALERLGADPKAVDSQQRSRLHYCIFSLGTASLCSLEEVERLLGLGLGANQADTRGNTPLHELMQWQTVRGGGSFGQPRRTGTDDILPLAEALLKAGADPDLPNYQGLSPLMLALQQRQFGVAGLLLERSKKPDMTVGPGYNLIHMVFLNSSMSQFELRLDEEREAFVRAAVARGVNPLAPIGDMGTLKDIAERGGAIELARFLTAF